jgi:hypothetical protein
VILRSRDFHEQAVDTCLAKLLAVAGEVDELLELLSGPNACMIEELETCIDAEKQGYLLCQVLRMNNERERVLGLLVR